MPGGVVRVVRVFGLADLLARFLALALGAGLGRTARQGERTEHDDPDDDDDARPHTTTSSIAASPNSLTRNESTISAMPRTIAPNPIQKIRRTAERPGYPIAHTPRRISMMPTISIIHHNGATWRSASAITKSNVPLITKKMPSNAARIVKVWNGDVSAITPPT